MIGKTGPSSKDLFCINDSMMFKRAAKETDNEKELWLHNQLTVLSVHEFLYISQSPWLRNIPDMSIAQHEATIFRK